MAKNGLLETKHSRQFNWNASVIDFYNSLDLIKRYMLQDELTVI